MRAVPRALVAVCIALACVRPAPAQRKPLDEREQRLVNAAIDAGVALLKKTQNIDGSWPRKDDSHVTGYTVLPGLTLLECGVARDDEAVKRAAAAVRRAVPKMQATYEIALTILFLDRLGERRDRAIIQTLASRLIAGQTVTGGWGYKCPLIGKADQTAILTALRKLDPEMPSIADRQRDGLAFQTGDGRKVSDGSLAEGSGRGNQSGSTESGTPVQGAALEVKPVEERPKQLRKPVKVADVVPQRLRDVPVFREKQVALVDPDKRTSEAINATTDNSNTQFAILALWAASKHDVPMVRTMRLVVRRFQTSQNEDGGWGYHYRNGGGASGSGAMTAVGLVGLAVGHALTENGGKVDPAILRGFAALSKHVGTAVDGGEQPKMTNLYNLWSIERVAVLYDLPTIARKDWYRWAAQLLVAHQQDAGNWDGGGYPGAHPIPDSCLALLVLKRANLARDLSERMAIDGKKLDAAIYEEAAPPKKETPKRKPKETAKPTPPNEKTQPNFATLQETGKPSETSPMPFTTGETPAPAKASGGVPGWVFVALPLAVLALGGGIICVVLHLRRERDEEEPEEKKRSRRKVRKPA